MPRNLYPAYLHKGDLSPAAFGPEISAICTEIHEACKGWGTDEGRLLKAMGSQTPETRCKVDIQYKKMFGKDLEKVIKSECGTRDFGTALQFLAVDPAHAECLMIQKACSGAGTNELLLHTILCGRTNEEMNMLKKKYFEVFTRDLSQVVASDVGGNLENLLLNVLQANEEVYDPEYHNDDKVQEDVAALYQMGQGKWGTNEVGLFKVIVASPPEYLKKVNLVYAEKYGYTLPKVLDKEMGGQVGDASVFMIGMKLKPIETIASLIDQACRGFGTNELLLTCTLIRYQALLKEVDAAHIEAYSQSIEERVKSETNGDYGKVLLEVIRTGMSM